MAGRLIRQLDLPVLLATLAIAGLGIYNLGSAGRTLDASPFLANQIVYLGLGLIAMTVVMAVDYRVLEGLAIPIFVFVVGLLLVTDAFGKVVNGSRRWLTLGPVNVQTSDLAKLAVIVIVAKLFHLRHAERRGVTLSEIFRPLNLSRPLIVLLGVIALSVAGERVRPPKLSRPHGARQIAVAKLSPKKPELVLGSSRDVDVVVSGAQVAARHALIVRVGDGDYRIRDLGSASGTYVNDQPVTEATLHDGDVIRLGLSPRAELNLAVPLEKLRPRLPYVAVLGLAWLALAGLRLARKRRFGSADLFAPIDAIALPAVLILVQPDLGTASIVVIVAFSMILYVGLDPISLVLLGVGGAVGSGLAWLYVLKPYQKMRVITFLNPEHDLSGAGYHQHQSLIAIGSGGASGKGFGQGTQTQLRFIPEQQTDFIFSVWAEEHGFVGALVLVTLFLVLVLACLRVAALAKDRFGALLVIGATALVFWHAVINILMVTRLAPVVGVPLPFMSYGGSFLVTTLMAIGLVLNVGMRKYVF